MGFLAAALLLVLTGQPWGRDPERERADMAERVRLARDRRAALDRAAEAHAEAAPFRRRFWSAVAVVAAVAWAASHWGLV